jgi:hypothetical protein
VFRESLGHSESFKLEQHLHVTQKEHEIYMGLKKIFAVIKKFFWWWIENKVGGLMYLTAVTGGMNRLC